MSDLPEPDPIRAERRRATKRHQLPPDARCMFCGVDDPDLLTAYTGKALLELHHVLGQHASDDVVVLCRNCHALQTRTQHDTGAVPPPGKSGQPDSVLERIGRALISLGVFLHDLAHTLCGFGRSLFAFVEHLDNMQPGWRNWEAAK